MRFHFCKDFFQKTTQPIFIKLLRSAPFVTTDQRPRQGASRPKLSLGSDKNNQDLSTIATTTNNENLVSRPVFSYKAFVSRTWALIVLTVAILGKYKPNKIYIHINCFVFKISMAYHSWNKQDHR